MSEPYTVVNAPLSAEDLAAEMRERMEELLAKKPLALLVFFELPGPAGAGSQIGVVGLGSVVDILTLYGASPDLMNEYHDLMVKHPHHNG